jgi:hypothetical protein
MAIYNIEISESNVQEAQQWLENKIPNGKNIHWKIKSVWSGSLRIGQLGPRTGYKVWFNLTEAHDESLISEFILRFK